MKLYVLIETCCMHFDGVFTEEEYKSYTWEYEDDKDGRMWYVYEVKDGKTSFLESLPAK